MVNYEALKEQMAVKVDEAVHGTVVNLQLALLRDDEFCRPLENMDGKRSALCNLAMHLIYEYTTDVGKKMQEQIELIMDAVAGMSIWPETEDKITPEAGLENLNRAYSEVQERTMEKEASWDIESMIRQLKNVQRLAK